MKSVVLKYLIDAEVISTLVGSEQINDNSIFESSEYFSSFI